MKEKFVLLIVLLLGLTACGIAERNSFVEEVENSSIETNKQASKVLKAKPLVMVKKEPTMLSETKKIEVKRSEATPEQENKPKPKEKKIENPLPTFTPTSFNGDFEIAVSAGNVRKGPSTQFKKVKSLKLLTRLHAFEKAEVKGSTWYHVKLGDGQNGWVSSSIVKKYDAARIMLDAPLFAQMPELPRGCEVTSLAMLLNHAGVNVGKMELAEKVKKVPFSENGLRGNPYDGFVGNMYTFKKDGLGVYHGPIAELANQYLPGRIVDLTGQSFDDVLKYVKQGKPVWVINTSRFRALPEDYWVTWKTKSGPVKITYKEHSVLVTGYDANYIYFNDPLAVEKNRKVAKSDFIAGWKQIGSQAITYN